MLDEIKVVKQAKNGDIKLRLTPEQAAVVMFLAGTVKSSHMETDVEKIARELYESLEWNYYVAREYEKILKVADGEVEVKANAFD